MIKEGIESLSADRRDQILSFLEVVKNVPAFNSIRFIVLYGSVPFSLDDAGSDIDIAISSDLGDLESEQLRMHLLGRVPNFFDIQIFEHLPLYVKKDVFSGMVLYIRDDDEIYDVAERTYREYDLFRPHLLDYIGERAL